MGLKREEQEAERSVECWPDNWLPFQVFAAMATQWNVGPSKCVGLRYETFPMVLQMHRVTEKEQAQVMQDIRVMELEALQLFNKS